MKRVLVVSPFGIGDALFLSPLLRAVKEEGRAEWITLLIGSRTEDVFHRNPYVDEVIPIDRDHLRRQWWGKTAQEMWRLLARLNQQQFDTFIDCSLSREYAFWAKYALHIPRRAGFQYKKRGVFLTHQAQLPQGFTDVSAVEHYARIGNVLGLPVTNKNLVYHVSDEDEWQATQFLHRADIAAHHSILCVAPGGGASWGKDARLKQWPPHYFQKLVEQLAGEYPIDRVVLLGSREERALADTIATTLALDTVNWCGTLPLPVVGALLKHARLLIANDGGLVHLAHAIGTPIIAFYGPVDARVYGPYPPRATSLAITTPTPLTCQPCYQRFRYQADCFHRDCLVSLEPQQVMEQVRRSRFLEMLNQGRMAPAT